MASRVQIDMSRLQRLLNRAGGVGERLLRRKAQRVADLAKVYASSHGSIPDGIVVGPFNPATKSIDVISTHPATLFVHNGTPPHPIRARRARALRFEVGGQVVYARAVYHPGYRGDPFLTKALRDVT